MSSLPSVIVVRPGVMGSLHVNVMTSPASQNGYVHPGELHVTSPLVRIIVEAADSNSRYVHLRFSHNNKYWSRDPTNNFLMATSNQPEEDTSNPSCTLFEPIYDGPSLQNFHRFIHVQSGARVQSNRPNERLIVETTGGTNNTNAVFSIIDWDTLVILPKYIAFKGDNGMYIRGVWITPTNGTRRAHLQLSGNVPNHENVAYEAIPYHNGHIHIRSEFFNRFWRSTMAMVLADGPTTNNDSPFRTDIFWPVKVNDSTIALRAITNNNAFCRRIAGQRPTTDILEASSNSMTNEARFELEELVLDRDIYDVRYRMEDSRIYDETPFVAGRGSATNRSNTESTLAIRIEYTESSSRSFSHSLSVELGVATSFRSRWAIITEAGIELSTNITNSSEWGSTTETSRTAEATYTVTVPPMSRARVNYVGVEGKCNVPFSYMQRDRRSSNGSFNRTEHIDGIFEGVNSYNFDFEELPVEPL